MPSLAFSGAVSAIKASAAHLELVSLFVAHCALAEAANVFLFWVGKVTFALDGLFGSVHKSVVWLCVRLAERYGAGRWGGLCARGRGCRRSSSSTGGVISRLRARLLAILVRFKRARASGPNEPIPAPMVTGMI